MSVPTPPPTAIIPSDEDATTKSLAYPMPVHITMSQYSFAYKNSSCGIIPTVVPPYSFAPLHADSITPPSPPQISTAPAHAISLPTSYDILLAMSVHLSLL